MSVTILDDTPVTRLSSAHMCSGLFMLIELCTIHTWSAPAYHPASIGWLIFLFARANSFGSCSQSVLALWRSIWNNLASTDLSLLLKWIRRGWIAHVFWCADYHELWCTSKFAVISIGGGHKLVTRVSSPQHHTHSDFMCATPLERDHLDNVGWQIMLI